MLGGYLSDDHSADDFLLDAGIHIIDLANFLLDDIQDVHTIKATDHASYLVSLRCESGGIGSLSMSCEGARGNASERLELAGHGTLTIVDNVINLGHWDSGDGSMYEIRPKFATSGNWTGVTTGFAGELQAFADVILDGRKPPSEIFASYRSMVLYEAIRDCHGRTVTLEEASEEAI